MVQQGSGPPLRLGTRLVHVGLFVVLAVVPVVAVDSLANAGTHVGTRADVRADVRVGTRLGTWADRIRGERRGIVGRPLADGAQRWPGARRRRRVELQSPPGWGSPTSNHQRATCSISVTSARSASLSDPGWRATRITASER